MKKDFVEQLLQQWAEERPGLDVSALGVVVRLQHLGKLLAQRANRALRQHELKHWEYDVLSVLRRQGPPFEMPATDIARAVHLTSGAMTTRIDGLENRRLVTRRRSGSDGRSVLIRLSANGRKLVDEALHTRLEDAEDVMQHLPDTERAELAACLRKLLTGLES
ncbi:MAG: MarR family transcriptional regulator [Woeseia sp.]|nr:MarR family transcriptional regulator [Woeseia sp.]MBT8096071.1 MarR family transcriptional regulator [Woeseia sp.]NNE62134.1 MarR family transcriptional regulator [Woeseia sp.]NNL54902.1 MarR family transcriptional regulator [Woeseia sp.]